MNSNSFQVAFLSMSHQSIKVGITFKLSKYIDLCKTEARNGFQHFLALNLLMGQYYKSSSVAATIMISNICQIIAEQVRYHSNSMKITFRRADIEGKYIPPQKSCQNAGNGT